MYEWLSRPDRSNPRCHMEAEYQKRPSADSELWLPVGEDNAKLRQSDSEFRIGLIAVENAKCAHHRISSRFANTVLQFKSGRSQPLYVAQI